MNQPRRNRSPQRRSGQGNRPSSGEIWRAPVPLPDVEPIAIPADLGALLRSLGDPPMIGGSAVASHYFAAVIEASAALAAALAFSADLLVESTDD